MLDLLDPITPGELLSEEFLKPLGLSQYRLAKEIGVPAQRIGQIVLGRRAITADTDLRLCRFFGLIGIGQLVLARNVHGVRRQLHQLLKSLMGEDNAIAPIEHR